MIAKAIKAKQEALINSLLQGGTNSGIADYASYKHVLGQIQGLEAALNVIRDNAIEEEEIYGEL